jgi:hypothetical protein
MAARVCSPREQIMSSRYGKRAAAHQVAVNAILAPAPLGGINPNESDPLVLWAEIARLRAATWGPHGYSSWQEAATAERIRRVEAERALAEMKKGESA